MNLKDEIQSCDMHELIDRLNMYAIEKLKSVGLKDFSGEEPCDFVAKVLLKVLEGKRKISKANCTFKEFLFGCLKSEISNFMTKKRSPHDAEEIENLVTTTYQNTDEEKKYVLEMLEEKGAEMEEVMVFECWTEGIRKPAEVAKYLELDVKEVNNITKRVLRKLSSIKNVVKQIL